MAECAHCGLPAPDGDPAFCCAGCRTVYEALHASGLADFYQLRAQLGEQSPQATDAQRTDRYLRFDDPSFQEQFSTADGSIELSVDGIHCAACVWLIERAPQGLPGFESARLDMGRGRVHLQWAQDQLELSEVVRYLHHLGYATRALDPDGVSAQRSASRDSIRRLGVAGASAGWTMMLAFALYAGVGELTFVESQIFKWGSFVGALPALLYAALPFYRSAWGAIRLRVPHTDLPIALAILLGTTGSVIGLIWGGEIYFDTLSVLVFLLLGARYIQTSAQREAWGRGALREALLPPTTERVIDGARTKISVGRLAVGDRVYVAPNATIPVDGRIVGSGMVDRALLTGESQPVQIEAGAKVHAGIRCVGRGFEVDAEAVGDQTRVGRLVALIDQAGAERPALVRLTDRWAGRFVIGILGLAAFGGLGWSIFAPDRALAVVVSLLVVSCPCALGLAAPLVLALTRSRASKVGIWFANVEAIERLANGSRVVFDKTGTLTYGAPRVVRQWGLNDELRGWIAALEADSEHPLARAVSGWNNGAQVRGEVLNQPLGLIGALEGHSLRVGAPRWLDAQSPNIDQALSAGFSVVSVELDGMVVGGFAVSDPIRSEAQAALADLRSLNLTVSMASGDDSIIVKGVAAQLGIDDAVGGLSPEEKAELVREPNTVMVGDGINDAVALSAAAVGIAISSGAEVALQVADISVQGGPKNVATAIRGSRSALRVIRYILTTSLLYNLICGALALAGQIDALAAAVLMPASSLFVAVASVWGAPFRRQRPSMPLATPELI